MKALTWTEGSASKMAHLCGYWQEVLVPHGPLVGDQSLCTWSSPQGYALMLWHVMLWQLVCPKANDGREDGRLKVQCLSSTLGSHAPSLCLLIFVTSKSLSIVQ